LNEIDHEISTELMNEEPAEDVEDDYFTPVKRAKNTIDDELVSYKSMCVNVPDGQSPIVFWKNAKEVCKY